MRRAEHIIIPLLDVLQSIPILGFFPIAIIFFINLFGSYIGAEISSIFLIFTSQVWNMTFGVYEAVKLIPRDVEEMARVYNIGRFLYVRKILVPATMTKLIYNSAMSWGGGWFFLYASEIISVGNAQISLPGLGSLLALSLMESPPRIDIALLSVSGDNVPRLLHISVHLEASHRVERELQVRVFSGREKKDKAL